MKNASQLNRQTAENDSFSHAASHAARGLSGGRTVDFGRINHQSRCGRYINLLFTQQQKLLLFLNT